MNHLGILRLTKIKPLLLPSMLLVLNACSMSGSYYSISNTLPISGDAGNNEILNQTEEWGVVAGDESVRHWQVGGKARCGGKNRVVYSLGGSATDVLLGAGTTTCAIRNLNSVFCWGLNTNYEHGSGTAAATEFPESVGPIMPIGGHSPPEPVSLHSSHSSLSFCLKTFQTEILSNTPRDDLHCWGREAFNDNSVLTPHLFPYIPTLYSLASPPLGGMTSIRMVPTRVTDGDGDIFLPQQLKSVSLGKSAGCFMTEVSLNFSAKCWGSNVSSALSSGSNFLGFESTSNLYPLSEVANH